MILTLHAERRDITRDEKRRELDHAGVGVAISTLNLFLARHGSRAKDTWHAIEQDRATVLR